MEMVRHVAFLTLSLAAMTFLGAAAAWGQTVAILPFANRTPPAVAPTPPASPAATSGVDQDQNAEPAALSNLDWIGESIAETLRDSMGARGVLTMGREDTDAAYKRLNLRPRSLLTSASAMKIGEAVDAEHVVYGSFEWRTNA